MASVFEGDVKKNLLERSDAEKVFRPWWDMVEDYMLNILVIIGGVRNNNVKTSYNTKHLGFGIGDSSLCVGGWG